jgi:hypothetical protein
LWGTFEHDTCNTHLVETNATQTLNGSTMATLYPWRTAWLNDVSMKTNTKATALTESEKKHEH